MRRASVLLIVAVALAAACGGSGSSSSSGSGGAGAGATGTGAGTTSSSSSSSSATSSGSGGAGGAGTGGATSSGGGSGAASSTSSGGGGGGAPMLFTDFCNGATTELTGVVYAPNGTDPLPGISVYAAKTVSPFPAQYCDLCASPIDTTYASTASAADGSFTLTLDSVPYAPTITFVVHVGRFRKVTQLPVAACTSAALPSAASTLPGKSADGEIPKIAVSSGNKDHLDAILTALGITEYDCYEGRKTAGGSTATCAQVPNKKIPDVLQSAAALDAYHMIFLSCAPGAYAAWGATYNLATINANVAAFAAGGGRMIATDTAYDYVEQAFPDAIAFAGPAAAPGVPQPIDGANVGCSTGSATPYPVKVDDASLTAWLKVVGIATAPNVSIMGFIQPWSVIASLPASTSLIADGSFGNNAPACTTTADAPLTAQFDVNSCGRVIYSSYHTLATVNPAGLTAQEKILEYLIFAAAGCHK